MGGGRTGIGLQLLQAIGGGGVPPGGGSHRAGGGGGWRQKILYGGKGWVGGKEARPGSACSRRFSAGSRGELVKKYYEPSSSPSGLLGCENPLGYMGVQGSGFRV